MSERRDVDLTSSFNQSSVANQNEVNGSSNCYQVNTSAYPFFMTVHSLVFLVGLLLNGYIMKFYFCRVQQQAPSSIMVYLKNLAAADFLLCLSLPIRIINYANNSVTIRLFYCNFGASVLFLNMYASILFMVYIAANRYLKIVKGTSGGHILQTVHAAHIISTVTWFLLLAMMSAYVILSVYTLKPSTSVPVSCEDLHSDQLTLLYKIIHVCSAAIFLLVLVSLVFFYYSVSRRVSLAQQTQLESSSSKKLLKSKRNMLVLVCVFCFCFVPYHLIRLPNTYLWRNCSWHKVFSNLLELTMIMSVLNICLDPLIYFIFCKAFRTRVIQRVASRNR